jgi:UDP-N-acetylmuramate: L-alanyl-gamma-D-glutamyl-meso-diaminopimelate ligase
VLVTAAGDANIADLLKRESAILKSGGRRVLTFGLENSSGSSADYVAKKVRADGMKTEFEVHRAGHLPTQVRMALIGDYNVKNALAAFALCEALGFDMAKVVSSFDSFQGVKRRQEIIGRPNDITIIEDFAHHPTAVKQTIETVQSRYPKSRVFSVFEARSATSRRSIFQKDYADALGVGHAVLMPPAFNQSSIAEGERFSTDQLISDLKARGVDANLCADVDGIVSTLKAKALPGDVILVMSNGGFGGIYEKLLKELA